MGQDKDTRLEGKVAIVTGAGAHGSVEGTGQATSIVFAREGAKVLLVDLAEENARKTLKTIDEEGGEASVFVGDVTKNADCQAMVEAAVERYSALHVLVNNVGISRPGTVVDVEEGVWDQVLDTNLKSMMLTSKHAIPRMIEEGGGSIINISSIDGLRVGYRPNIAYVASKGGVNSLTRAMAVHHGRDNIRTNCIAPGHIHATITSTISDEWRDLRRRAGPLGTEGTAWDVAWAALFLASDESRWISGAILPVDAGLLATTPLSVLDHLR
jgi:NAD(P)-dependent dehydrogenase (short-subunit alcohol dehydrogenase family)